MEANSKIFVAGHTGMVGSAVLKRLQDTGFQNLITVARSELDLQDYRSVANFFEREKPEYVFLAAGRTGGVYANATYRAEFLYENMLLQSHVIHCAYLFETKRLINFACSSMFPADCPKPILEDHLLTGPLEETNEPFALAKIVGHKMCEYYNEQYGTDFISVIPTNIYGPGQRYDTLNSGVIPGLIRKISEAKAEGASEVGLWGSGEAKRDFLYTDDLADASIFLLQNSLDNSAINIATGTEHSIRDVANRIKEIIGFEGEIVEDRSKPEGVHSKLQNVDKITALGWQAKVDLDLGLRNCVESYKESYNRS